MAPADVSLNSHAFLPTTKGRIAFSQRLLSSGTSGCQDLVDDISTIGQGMARGYEPNVTLGAHLKKNKEMPGI